MSHSSSFSHEKGKSNKKNVINLPLQEGREPVYFNCMSDKSDIDLIITKLVTEISKIDVLCDVWDEEADEQKNLPLKLLKSAVEQRAEALKVIAFNLQMLKRKLK